MRSGYVRYHDELAPLMVPIDSVHQAPSNYNNGDVELIKESIMEVGMYRPVIVDRDTGDILAGNHTYAACLELGAEVIPVVRVDADSAKDLTKIMVADNRIASLAKPDHAQLLSLLTDLAADDMENLRGTGYTETDLEMLELLNDMAYDPEESDFASWPSLTLRVHPKVLGGFHLLTREAETDNDKLELLLRRAGWDRSVND